jgi:predicted ribosome quality control (RQC) complex YloA/Tae2 family protein
MKTTLSALDLYFLVKEFKILIGGKVDKIYEMKEDKKDFLFTFHVTGRGKMMLRFKLPGLVYLTTIKEAYPETPPGYCMFLRKYLTNARLKDVRQEGFERILNFTFERWNEDAPETVHLIVELFSKGNMMLCDEDMKIKNPLENQHWTGREIRAHQPYGFPPTTTNTPLLTEQEIVERIAASDKESIVKTLAMDFALGGDYAEEICTRTHIPKDKKNIDDKERTALAHSLKYLLNEAIMPIKIGNNILPFAFSSILGDKIAYDTYSQALDANFSLKQDQKDEIIHQEKTAKAERILHEQEQKIKGFELSAQENQRKGEIIYEHYLDVKTALEDIKTMAKKQGWLAVKQKYKDHAFVKEIDEKKGTITVEFE